MANIKAYPIVAIEWADSVSQNGIWQTLEEVDYALCKCLAVGYLIKRDKDVTVLASNISGCFERPDFDVSGVTVIPSQNVTSIKRVNQFVKFG